MIRTHSTLHRPMLAVLVAGLLGGSGCAALTEHRPLTTEQTSARDAATPATSTPFERQPSPYPDRIRPVDDLVLAMHHEQSALQAGVASRQDDRVVLRLHIGDCHIQEAEPYAAAQERSTACREFNRETFDGRRQRVLHLPSGRVDVLIYNRSGRAETGLWLRAVTDAEPRTVASTGGVRADSPQLLSLDLAPGRYLYSSPVNPTPDYLLIVDPVPADAHAELPIFDPQASQ